MLVINYNGNKPTTDYHKYSVQGNNLADTIRFLVSLNQNGLVFDNTYHIYAKVQSVDDDFYDKVELSEIVFDDSENLLKADFHLESKHTSHRQIEVSLSCENLDSEIVWQTQLVKVSIANGVNADEEIENTYPTILEQLQAQIDELKEQGGGGSGASDVEVKRVYLTYDEQKSIKMNTLIVDKDGEYFTNDSTHIWLNFETTPINDKMEEMIKANRFVIRLDYPIKSHGKSGLNFWDDGTPLLKAKNQRRDGAGVRSFTHTFAGGLNYLMRYMFFVSEDDIKTNRYNEKYIHKKVKLSDYIKKACDFHNYYDDSVLELSPITNEMISSTGEEKWRKYGQFFFQRLAMGVPANKGAGLEQDQTLYKNGFVNKFYVSNTSYWNGSTTKPSMIKYNHAISCYTTLYTSKTSGGSNHIYMTSRLFRNNNRRKLHYTQGNVENNNMCVGKWLNSQHIFEEIGLGHTRRNDMVAKPRCAILNENYETSTYAFDKVYSQSNNQIRLFCNYIYDLSDDYYELDYFMPVFRLTISQK